MNYGLSELLSSCAVLPALPVFFIAPGYAAASATNLMQFARRSWAERLLWAAALSTPLSILLAVHPLLALSPRLTTLSFGLLFLCAGGYAYRDLQTAEPSGQPRIPALAVTVAASLVIYVLFAAVPLAWHGRLYETSLWQDWNVRIQLINAAVRGGIHPGNPMFASGGVAAPLHYYFYWYVLCARIHDIVPVDARAILTASCIGSALSLVAFLLLAVRYLGEATAPLRQSGVAALLVACILGLDFIPFLIAALLHRSYADLQFWLDDRSPGWLGMIVWSPHHVAGLICCGLGTLLFVQSLHVTGRQRGVHAALAAVCFAASAGTSTFITLIFAFACLLLFGDALLQKQWAVVTTMLGATALAVVLTAPFFYTLLHTPVGSAGTAQQYATHPEQAQSSLKGVAQAPVLAFAVRYNGEAIHLVQTAFLALHHSQSRASLLAELQQGKDRWARRLLKLPVMLGFFVSEFGFFLFVLAFQIRHDFFSGRPVSRSARILWLLFVAIAIPGFLLSSGGLQNNNDFGRHAGFCLRLILILWATPPVTRFLARGTRAEADSAPTPYSPFVRWALIFACAGLISQAAEVLLLRSQIFLVEAGLLPRVLVEERIPHSPWRFGQIEQAMAAATAITPNTGIVQGNPNSRLHGVFLLYTSRQMAASDDGCNIPFGGSANSCVPMSRALVELFGGLGPHLQGEQNVFRDNPVPFETAASTPQNFYRICSTYRLNTVVATYVDPIWWHRDSWVWSLHPAYANSTARVFSCSAPGVHATALTAASPVVH